MLSVNTLWYASRGTGLVSLVLLTLAVVAGIGARSGRPALALPRFAVSLVHRNVSLLSVAFLAVHVVTLLFDRYARLRWYDVVLPFAAQYRPVWVGLGTVGLDLMAAVIITSLLRHRIGVGVWRFVHWSAYLAWPVGVAHTIGSGTDNTSAWLIATTAVCVAAVVGAGAWRLSARFSEFTEAAPAASGPVPAPPSGPHGRHSADRVSMTGPLPRVRLDERR